MSTSELDVITTYVFNMLNDIGAKVYRHDYEVYPIKSLSYHKGRDFVIRVWRREKNGDVSQNMVARISHFPDFGIGKNDYDYTLVVHSQSAEKPLYNDFIQIDSYDEIAKVLTRVLYKEHMRWLRCTGVADD